MKKGWDAFEPVSTTDKVFLAGKSLMRSLCLYEITEYPVFIFSTRRSGSTLLLRMIYSQQHIDYVDQPLDLWKPHRYFYRLPHPPCSQFISLDQHEEDLLLNFFEDLISGNIRLRNQWNVTDGSFSFRADRLVVKLLNCLPLIDWFSEQFDPGIIFHIRHPIPVALSVIRRGWENVARAYLQNEMFCKKCLCRGEIEFGRWVLNQGSRFQKLILEWCLRNVYPLRVKQNRNWHTQTYEEVVMRPKKVIGLICKRFDLSSPARMLNVVRNPTSTTTRSSRDTINSSGTKALASKWIEQVGPEKVDEAKVVLNKFNIEVYSASSPWPDREVCNFGKLAGQK